MNLQEEEFHDMLVHQGYTVLRRGWPDFLVIKNGVVVGVEIKSEGFSLSDEQRQMHKTLEMTGVKCFTCYNDDISLVSDFVETAGSRDAILRQINNRYMAKNNDVLSRLRNIKNKIENLYNVLGLDIEIRNIKRKDWTIKAVNKLAIETLDELEQIMDRISNPPTKLLEQWFQERDDALG